MFQISRIALQKKGLGHCQPLPEGKGTLHLPQFSTKGGESQGLLPDPPGGPHRRSRQQQPQGHGGKANRQAPAKEPPPSDIPHRLSPLPPAGYRTMYAAGEGNMKGGEK